jgi:hypothetical protein
MNWTNATALELIIRSFFTSPFPTDYQLLAEGLARRGVLVPDALTDEDVWKLCEVVSDIDGVKYTNEEARTELIRTLHRFAKGGA